MVLRLVSGILAIVFGALGLAFLIVFGAPGVPVAVVGAVFAVIFVTLVRGERRRRERRTLRASVPVLDARINHGVQLNARRQLKLRVRLGAGEVEGSFFWLPSDPIGERIDVRYDPDEPANFAPVPPGE